MPNPLIAVSKLMERLEQSTYWIKRDEDYAKNNVSQYHVKQNEALLAAAHKTFDALIEAGIDAEIGSK